ncbi:MAG: ISKra4 family transposase [Acidimicrobiales bacterium]
MIANSDTHGECVSAPADELREGPGGGGAGTGPAEQARGEGDPFARSRESFERIVGWLSASETAGCEHGDLEALLDSCGRELLCCLLQDHLDLRALCEQRLDGVADAFGVERRAVETGHERPLDSVFGQVSVERLAYRQRGEENRYVADGILNLPAEHASHGVRRLAALEAAAGSFEHATSQVRERTGLRLAKRRVEQLVVRAVVDFESFYAERGTEQQEPDERDVLVLSADGKGIVMRSEALREATAKAAQRASPKLKTRLSRGEKANRKRLAEVGAVYELTPAPRTPEDVLAPTAEKTLPAPKAKHKWLTASVIDDAASVIADIFDEAERRDPEHKRTWIALVDGNNHQIDRIKAEAKTRKIKVTIIVDYVHVLEYIWSGAWSFFAEGDPAAEKWVQDKALAVLAGDAGQVAAAIRRKATLLNLPDEKRAKADRTADYLLNKRPYLDYRTALKRGWPIATGVIEGACRHLVKDRMDITGARWGLQGAEAILQLRALISNNDFDSYWDYHIAQERHRNHDLRYLNSVIPRET